MKRSFSLIEIIFALLLISLGVAVLGASGISFMRKRTFTSECRMIHEHLSEAFHLSQVSENEVDAVLLQPSQFTSSEESTSRGLLLSIVAWGLPQNTIKAHIERIRTFNSIDRCSLASQSSSRWNDMSTSPLTLRFFAGGIEKNLGNHTLTLYSRFGNLSYDIDLSQFLSRMQEKNTHAIPAAIEEEAL